MRITAMDIIDITGDIEEMHPIEEKRKSYKDLYTNFLFYCMDEEFTVRDSILDFEKSFRKKIEMLDPNKKECLNVSYYAESSHKQVILHLKKLIEDEKLSNYLHNIFLNYSNID